MKNNRKIGVLFVLDGVLVDSEGEYSKCWGATGRKFNVGELVVCFHRIDKVGSFLKKYDHK